MKKHLFILFWIGMSLVGCNQEETIEPPKEILAESPQTEQIEEKPFTVRERQSDGYKSLKEVVKSDEIKAATEIIENAEWDENIRMDMAHPTEYRLAWVRLTTKSGLLHIEID